ncbi:MAG: YidC/Oxa1 family membrane protein insertase, partial [Clostridia bacterium]|nr:YidC/Oxa1 family membrane protein insertase [Clostridia bacterium]
MNSLLAQTQNVLGYSVSTIPSISLDLVGQLIRILIEGIGIVGVGIIVFTLILKCIVLPLDIYSRISGKKQALIMERMRPQMEKLQQQYANDKTMYNQKVAELQKKSGFSMLGSCLPILVSLAIFIFVWQSFAAYSQYANLESYNDLVKAYNGVVKTYVIEDENSAEDYGFLVPVYAEDVTDTTETEPEDYEVKFDKFAAHYNHAKSLTLSEDEVFLQLAQDYKKAHTGYDGAFSADIVNQSDESGNLTDTASAIRVTLVNFYLEEPAAQAAADYYKEHNNSFLWVRNLWYPDSMFNKEMPSFA